MENGADLSVTDVESVLTVHGTEGYDTGSWPDGVCVRIGAIWERIGSSESGKIYDNLVTMMYIRAGNETGKCFHIIAASGEETSG